MIIAVTLLLCGGTVTAAVLTVRTVADRAREAVKPITDPTLPGLPTDAPDPPSATPGRPTATPGLPSLPTGLPDLPGQGTRTITVTYEVTGDGPAEILYAERLGQGPRRVRNATLPWRITTEMDGTALVLVTAIRTGPEPGSIRCRVTVDGDRIVQNTREGSYTSVTCSKLIMEQ